MASSFIVHRLWFFARILRLCEWLCRCFVPFIVLRTHAIHSHILYSSPHRISKPQANPICIRIAMKPRPLLPLYDNESPEEEKARSRAKELQDAQPSPHDNPCTSLSKWLARNSRIVNRFGLAAAIVLGMKAISTSSVFEVDVLDLSIESNYGEFILSDQNDEDVNQSEESRRRMPTLTPSPPSTPDPTYSDEMPMPVYNPADLFQKMYEAVSNPNDHVQTRRFKLDVKSMDGDAEKEVKIIDDDRESLIYRARIRNNQVAAMIAAIRNDFGSYQLAPYKLSMDPSVGSSDSGVYIIDTGARSLS